jgi:hypothetical protein
VEETWATYSAAAQAHEWDDWTNHIEKCGKEWREEIITEVDTFGEETNVWKTVRK